MALEMNDIMALKALGGREENTSFENYMVAHKESKRASGTAIAGLAVGIAGVVAGVSAWIFGGTYANGKAAAAREAARGASDVANANHNAMLALYTQGMNNTNANLDRLARTLERETDARVSGDINLTNTVNDTVSGSQQGTLTAMQQAELNATQQLMIGLQTGKYSENPQQVVLMSGRRECACPASGCGCNG